MVDENPFPGLTNILQLFKARITRPPAAVSRAQAGWVVWIAEVYPGLYLARIPGASVHYTEHSRMIWEQVSADTPLTTIADSHADERSRLATVRQWQPGQEICTPGTRLSWASLTEWIAVWQQLQRRRHSSHRYAQEAAHKLALPPEMLSNETEPAVLYNFLDLIHSTDIRPPRGMRADHPITRLVVAANNRLAQLSAGSYQRHRQQAALRRALPQTELLERTRAPDARSSSHLSLF